MNEGMEHTMSKAPDPRLGSNADNEQPKATTPAPAGYFSTPEPAPVFGPEPAAGPDTDSVTAATSGTPASAGNATTTAQAVRHPVRVGTVVWGAVVLVLGTLTIVNTQLNLDLNAGLTAMWLLLGAGVAMLAGGIIDVMRRKQRQDAA